MTTATVAGWTSEDGGPRRTQTIGGPGLGLRAGARLEVVARRDVHAATMVVRGGPGEVFLLRHTLGRRPLEDPVTAWVERIDPRTLEVVERSPDLAAGPFWPGGAAVRPDGSLHVVAGEHCHRLSPGLEPLASVRLPSARPHNSFVTLGDGTLAIKDFDRSLRAPARLVLLDPETLERRCPDVDLGEPAIARLTADGDTLYVVGARTLQRFAWDGTDLARDDAWSGYGYVPPHGSYGWDPVVAGEQLWFLDNGEHDFVTTMLGAGVAPGPVHLHRVALADAEDRERVEVCGLPRGAVTDPPLYDPVRRIAVAYDSANGVVQAFRFNEYLEPLWRAELAHAAHMILFAETGELVLGDFHGPRLARTAAGRALLRRTAAGMRSARVRGAAARLSRDDVVVVDIETGTELGRARVPTIMQSVVFPAPGEERDLYWLTFSTLARVAAT